MTRPEPSPEMLVARRIACDIWGLTDENRQAVLDGRWDDIRQVKCALAALIEASERAARLAMDRVDFGIDPNTYSPAREEAHTIATALANMEHFNVQS